MSVYFITFINESERGNIVKELLKIKNEEIEFVLTNFEKIKCYGFSGSENAKYKFFWNASNKGVISVKRKN